jgi:hypothetical protein
MIQKQSNNCWSERAHNHQEQKRCSRSRAQQRACLLVVLMWRGLFTVNLFLRTLVSSDFSVMFKTLEKKCVMRKAWTLMQPQLAPSRQRNCPHFPESHRVYDQQQHDYHSPSFLLARLSPLWFCFVSQIANETEGMTFWNSVWHPKGIASGTQQH